MPTTMHLPLRIKKVHQKLLRPSPRAGTSALATISLFVCANTLARIAQWDGSSRKYYFVQISTGTSQWDVPTQAAPTVPTPGATPQNVADPFPRPNETGAAAGPEQAGEGERGFGVGAEG